MGAWPSGAVPTTDVDASTDNPANARDDIKTCFDRVNAMMTARADANGVCELDAGSLVPANRLDNALKKTNNLSDLASAATARTNLGGTTIGKNIFTAADAAAVRSLIAAMGTAGGTFTGEPSYAADPGSANVLSRKSYVDAQVATKNAAIKVAIVADHKAQNTQGGTFTSGAWQTRDLQTETDPSSIVSISSNQFTLGAGTYILWAQAPAYSVTFHQARLYNVTDAGVVATGQVARVGGATIGAQSPSNVFAVTTIAGSKAFRVEHRCSNTRNNDGFGDAANLTTEVYTQVLIVQIA